MSRRPSSTAEATVARERVSPIPACAARTSSRLAFSPRPGLTSLARLPLAHRFARLLSARLVPGSYFYELARTRHLDGVVGREVKGGARQVVLLGAGYDTRPYRLGCLGRGVRVFEVDLPAISAEKRRRVAKALGGLPGHVTYVVGDLEQGGVHALLAAAGWDPLERTLVLWVGVSMYASADAVAGVLCFAARCAPGSALVFDYAYADAVEDRSAYPGLDRFRSYVARRGEPLTHGIERGALAALLAEHGLGLEADLGPRDLERL